MTKGRKGWKGETHRHMMAARGMKSKGIDYSHHWAGRDYYTWTCSSCGRTKLIQEGEDVAYCPCEFEDEGRDYQDRMKSKGKKPPLKIVVDEAHWEESDYRGSTLVGEGSITLGEYSFTFCDYGGGDGLQIDGVDEKSEKWLRYSEDADDLYEHIETAMKKVAEPANEEFEIEEW